jgi:thiamine pyrophosphate-dependent acetolactate synthase large subunit-like protein
MNGTEFIAKILKAEGIDSVTCFPSNPLIEAVAKEGIRPISFRNERGAVMAADGFSRISQRKKFGVAIVQSQAGAENAMGGIAQAYADNIPILLMPGGISLSQLGVKPNFSVLQNYQGWVKQVETLLSPNEVGNVMRRSFNALRNGPPGPVVVEMTSDVCSLEIPKDSENYCSPRSAKVIPSQNDIRDTVKYLMKAKKPLIWAGGGVLMSGASKELKKLVEFTGIPVFTTMQGKSAFDERHPLSLGAGCGTTTLAAHNWLKNSDVVLVLGSSLTRTPYGQVLSSEKTILHNTIDPEDLNKDVSAMVGLVGDTKLTLLALMEEFKTEGFKKDNGEVTQIKKEINVLKKKWMQDWNPILNSGEIPLNYYRIINEIYKNIDPENSIVTHDAGAPRDCMVPFYNATLPNSYIGWGKTTHLGFGIPLMIGAKMAHPDKFCLNLMGDGAFGMSGLDLETSVRAELPITTVLLNNGAMSTYEGTSLIGPVSKKDYGVSSMKGNYAKIAKGMGAEGIRVEKPNELEMALKNAQQLNKDGKTVLIDVISNVESRRSKF